MLSRILGLIRDMAFSAFFGAGQLMDAWVIAFQIPNLSRRLFGEGAASASFIPVYRHTLEHDPENANKLASTVLWAIVLILLVIVSAGLAGIFLYLRFAAETTDTKMMLSLVALMLPYMILICSVAILAGILNTHHHFAAPAAAPIILNVFIIGGILFSAYILDLSSYGRLFFVAFSVLVAGLVQIAFQLPPLRKHGVTLRPTLDLRLPAVRKIFFLMVPMILGLTATQINTLADTWIAKFFSGSVEKGEYLILFGNQIKYPVWEGAVSHLYYAQRMYQFPLGVLGISLATAIFPVMSANAAKKDQAGLCRTISTGLRGSVFVAIPATVGLLLVAEPLIGAVFERGKFTTADTVSTAWILVFYSLGLCGFFAQQILTRSFYSLQDSRMPAITGFIAVMVNIPLNLTLIWYMGTAGLALSTAMCSYIQVAILLTAIQRRFGDSLFSGVAKTVMKSLIATAIMFAFGFFALRLISGWPLSTGFNVLRLVIVVPLCAGIYLLAAIALKIEARSLITGQKKV